MKQEPSEVKACRVLVVDDNKDSAETLALLLELSGNSVSVAFDGEEAIQVAREQRPQAVLLDITLPKRDGYAVAQAIRAEPWGEHMVLVALTGWGDSDDKRRATEAGFNFHMVKPVDPEEVVALLAGI